MGSKRQSLRNNFATAFLTNFFFFFKSDQCLESPFHFGPLSVWAFHMRWKERLG